MNNKMVVLDYGHGGTDPGACSDGYQEKVWNIETGKAAKEELDRHGVVVYETRVGDQTLSINQRCSIANKSNAKWFVSIHHNGGKGDRGEAIHSIYAGDGKELADKIGEELKAIGQTNIKIYSKTGAGNKDYYGVIRGTKMDSVIVEVCFIDNAVDREIADTLEERQRNGRAIAHAILKKIGIAIKQDTGTESNTPEATFSNGSYSGKKARVVADSLNVRYDRWINEASEPKVVGALPRGKEVELEYCLNGWVSIKGFKGKKGLGYVNSKYLQLIW